MQWWHTAGLMAIVANCHRDEKKRSKPYTARDFHPDTCQQAKALRGADMVHMLAGALVSPEKARAAEAKALRDQAQARLLADAQRARLRLVA